MLEIGGAEYAKLGIESSTGTRVFSLSGNVVNGGNYELPHGFPLRDLINDLGGGVADGHALKAVIPGGSSTVILTGDEANRVTLDFDSLVGAGTAIGSGGVIVIDESRRVWWSALWNIIRPSTSTSRAASAPRAAKAPTG